MKLTLIDWLIVAAYMGASILLGIYFTRRASSSTDEFFLSGRKIPWWLAGTSMVATTFSADTPLYVTGLVRSHGVYENWQWWCFLISGMLAVAIFAKLWKSAGVMTDVELTEVRYSGKPAAVLRGFKAIYFSVFIHTIIKAQVILAMAKILDVALGWSKWEGIIISSLITIFYSLMSGYWGVILTDFLQFIIAMAGAILIAYFAVDKAGGLATLSKGVESLHGNNQHFTDFFPPLDGGILALPVLTFIAYMGMSWWSKYSSDGGGVIVQRMVSCKNERHAIGATFYFNIANYALRSWPWILAAVASLMLYPAVLDHESVYPMMMVDLLPKGFKGLMLASFFAAFMSTLSTYLNLSSAYLINDFYRRFVKKERTEKHYLIVTRISILVLSIITAIVTYHVTSIVEVFKFLIAFGSGAGLVFIMRWFWWRINAWSEISAMTASTLISSYIYIIHPEMPYYAKLFSIIFLSAVVWITVTFLTKPVDRKHLEEFMMRVKVSRIGRHDIKNWIYGCVFIYGLTIGLGMLFFQRFVEGGIYLVLSVISGIAVYRGFSR